jgi:hypothetical protein
LSNETATTGGMSRTSSMRRVTQSSSIQSGANTDSPAERPPKVRHSRASVQLSDLSARSRPSTSAHQARASISHSRTSIHLSESGTDSPQPESTEPTRLSKHRVSRSSTSAQLSDLLTDSPSDQGRPPKPRQSLSSARAPSSILDTSMPPPPVPKPTPRKGFPAGITKGLPSAISSPNLNSPLLASKRIPSGQLQSATGDKRPGSNLKPVKTVEEKKELVSLVLCWERATPG